jgi:hypothetical protein
VKLWPFSNSVGRSTSLHQLMHSVNITALAAHVMFAHHHLTPSMDRDKAGPMPFKNITTATPPPAAAAAGTDTAGANGSSEAAGQQQQQQQRPAFFQAARDPAGAFEYSTRK